MSVATVQSVATVVTVMSVLSAESAGNRDGQDTCTVLYSAMHGLGPIDHPSRDTGYPQWRIQRGFHGFHGTPLLKGCL